MATRLLHLMPRLRRVLLGNGRQVSFNRVRDIPADGAPGFFRNLVII